ncbi:DUF6391 domain-containing protein [Crocosphaera watsonii]|uniref:Uncharacterized protein n=3 Tax=Crocosphaera watsonii TaxID=263511 RepID=T2JRQ4_CROWT|nr:DUF6391 domain-containing protein [Crocosphaera watsonii]EHJ09684.1 hypothetical protein CWATWH0003_5540 [Crocosphaera watsonii WH 0003]CCQ58122.1 hypothetical protein CWATWH0005_3662 [Crocosphaera watsonii WH 0005]CCQ67756.1 hypothetical protein CWATWH0402_6306 [Crocosphaera watsonii WH 0402]
MTNSVNPATGNLWDLDWYRPQHQQDSDTLEQLGFIPGLKEILMLRQVHGLEHGTVWVLSETRHGLQDNENLGGLSTPNGFYLYGEVNHLDLQKAVTKALQRFRAGVWNLAVHPRCGTNMSVNMLLITSFALGTHFLLPKGPIEQALGLLLATSTASQLSPDLGILAQKYLTTAIPFNLELGQIARTRDFSGHPAYFVELAWRDS